MPPRENLIALLEYIEQAEKIRREPVFRLSQHRRLVEHEADIRGLPGLRFDLAEDESAVWLKVERLRPAAPPPVGPELAPWIVLADDPRTRPVLQKEIPNRSAAPQDGEDVRRLEEEPAIEAEFKVYVASAWEPWAIRERPRRAAIGVYNRLFALHQTVEAEGVEAQVEVVWGIGMAVWAPSGGERIEYPLVTKAVELHLNPHDMSIDVVPRDSDPVMELDPYDALGNPGVRQVEERARSAFGDAEVSLSPFDRNSFEEVLRTSVTYLDPSGIYHPDVRTDPEDRNIPAAGRHLTVTDAWVLFARPRSQSFLIQDLRRLRKHLEDEVPIPAGPAAIVTPPSDQPKEIEAPVRFRGVSGCGAGGSRGGDGGSGPAKVKELYFPKPFNQEQVAIVERLERAAGVVVQGPPGTGKTHTIGNVICHYLAQGKRVLVTSKGEPALAVLQQQIPESIRPLTISLLTSEREGMKQFEHAVHTIASEVGRLQPWELRSRIQDLERRIDTLHQKIAAADGEIAEWAAKHLRPVDVDGREMMPDALARQVLADEEAFRWLADEPSFDQHPKFTDGDVGTLREARAAVGIDLAYLGRRTPAADDLPDGVTIVRLHQDLVRLRTLDEVVSRGGEFTLADSSQDAVRRAEDLHQFLDAAIAADIDLSADEQPWTAGLRERLGSATPDGLVRQLEALLTAAKELRSDRDRYLSTPVTLPIRAELNADLRAACRRRAEDKSAFGLIPFGKVEARKLFSEIRVCGAAPSAPEHWALVCGYLELLSRIRQAVARWDALAAEVELPAIGGDGPDAFRAFLGHCDHIERIRAVATHYDSDLAARVRDVLGPTAERAYREEGYSALPRIVRSLETHLARERLAATYHLLDDIQAKVTGTSGPVVDRLSAFLSARLGKRDIDAGTVQAEWSALLAELRRVAGLRRHLDEICRVSDLIEASGGPRWADVLRRIPSDGSGDPGTPHNWREAWTWRRIRAYLDGIDGRDRLRRLAGDRAEHERSLERSYQDLVSARTWLELYARTTDRTKSALQAYLNAVGRMGRGTGIRAVRYRREARDAMADAHAAVPCWIMPHWRVSETLPAQIGCFDLVVVDEASQSDLWALPALLRGKQLLVVGDDKQVSPDGVGLEEAKIVSLKARYLAQQPFGAEMTPEKSIYDLAKVVFAGDAVMLREHFRCVEPIIAFSNREFYGGEIRPLRVPKASQRIDPPLVDVLVKGGYRKPRSKVNPPEARAIVEEVKRIIADPRLKGRTLGVVSLIGFEQAHEVFRLLEQEVGSEEIVSRQITCGDARTFQGKERDIILLSMVADPTDNPTLTRKEFQQRFNVAASRARDRMILFRSVSREDLRNPEDLKAKLVLHFHAPMQQSGAETSNVRDLCESGFERAVFDELFRRGYRVTPQVPVGGFRIDLVVEGQEDRRLAIECDGDSFHGPERWEQDIARQRVLERAGWTFWRCWASTFALHREECISDLLSTLQRLEIGPAGQTESSSCSWVEHRVLDPLGSSEDDTAVPSHGSERDLCQSGFERAVFDELVARGYGVLSQVEAEGFRIDLVVEGDNGARLAIECDGDSFHGPERLHDDEDRQGLLEKAGWSFWRCRASTFATAKDECMRDLVAVLDRMGIQPNGRNAVAGGGTAIHQVPVDRDRQDGPDGGLRVVPSAPLTSDPPLHPAPTVGESGRESPSASAEARSEQTAPVVEVGDLVAFAFQDRPGERKRVQIGSVTNLEAGLLAEATPLAQALLGAEVGDIVELNTAGSAARRAEVLEIKKGRVATAPQPGIRAAPQVPLSLSSALHASPASQQAGHTLHPVPAAPISPPAHHSLDNSFHAGTYDRVRRFLQVRGVITSADLQAHLHLDARAVRPYLVRLVHDEVAVAEGHTRGMKYKWKGRTS